MDIATLVGIVSGFFFIFFSIFKGGGSGGFLDFNSVMITIGGTFAATFVNFPMKEILEVMGIVKKAFLHKMPSPVQLIETMVEITKVARRQGILAMEKHLNTLEDDFLKKGIQLVIDGTNTEMIRSILYNDISNLEERHRMGYDIFVAMGTFSPAFGMIGTLIGLIKMLQNLNDPTQIGSGMAVALITTFYGAILANLVYLPIAGKLKTRSKQEVQLKEMIITGVLSIQSGDNPRLVQEKLFTFLRPKERNNTAT